ncbi:MAG: type II toxin-antitoxin system VapC family toxin [Nodosilinea sp.]
MKILFDSSVLVPALVPAHPRHGLCYPYLKAAKEQQTTAYISTHSLAEVYGVITRLPVKPRPTPTQAQTLLTDVLTYVVAVPLTRVDYAKAIDLMASLTLPGGGIFDALIAQAALKAEVNCLLTLNPDDFTRLSPQIAGLVNVPQGI